MKLYYFLEKQNTVVRLDENGVSIWTTGVKAYGSRRSANPYLRDVAEGKAALPETPDSFIPRREGETDQKLADRTVEQMEDQIGYFERIFPKDGTAALETPKTFYKSVNIFPAMEIWYADEKAAEKDADGFDTIYLGPVEVYDPDEIKRIEDEIASYPEEDDDEYDDEDEDEDEEDEED